MFKDFERWLFGFGEVIRKMEEHQKLRVSRITTPNKICGGMMINKLLVA